MTDKQTSALVEQLQNVHSRQRKLVQQLQAENARLLSDLADVRRERDNFREEAGRCRKELAELQNKFDEMTSRYQDLKRSRSGVTLTRTASSLHNRPHKAYLKPNSIQYLTTDGDVSGAVCDYLESQQDLPRFSKFTVETPRASDAMDPEEAMTADSLSQGGLTRERTRKVMGARPPRVMSVTNAAL